MYENHLASIGLSASAAKIYAELVHAGPLPASTIARRSGIERSMTYVVLGELETEGLVTKDSSKKVARFVAKHPRTLEKLVQHKQQAAENASASFETIIYQLQQEYEVQSGQPGVRFFSGVEGLKYINNHLKTVDMDEMLLIRSLQSSAEVEGYQDLIRAQRELRVKKSVPIRIIGPSVDSMKIKLKDDEKYLVERRIIAKEMFDTPAQILIFNNTIAITTYTEPMLTTVIEHTAISVTMKTLFNYIWQQSRKETDMFIKKFSDNKK